MTRILVVEDEPRISSFVEMGLRAEGFSTAVVEDGESALEMVRLGGFDLVVLDIGLPGIDGLTVLRRLRAEGHSVPVVVLTARDAVDDTVAGFETGADDYLVKPFRFAELLVRIRARLRAPGSAEETVLRRGRVSLHLRSRRVDVGGRSFDLTAREFALAETLLRHPDQVLSREQLLSRVWGYDYDPSSNVVEVYVGYLRGKLGADAIETVRGMGYRLR